jgi:hypothetical protein
MNPSPLPGKNMLDEEITSLLEDAGYRFAPESTRYQVYLGPDAGETDHSSEFVADELGIDPEDLRRWEDQQLESQGLTRQDPEPPTPAE